VSCLSEYCTGRILSLRQSGAVRRRGGESSAGCAAASEDGYPIPNPMPSWTSTGTHVWGSSGRGGTHRVSTGPQLSPVQSWEVICPFGQSRSAWAGAAVSSAAAIPRIPTKQRTATNRRIAQCYRLCQPGFASSPSRRKAVSMVTWACSPHRMRIGGAPRSPSFPTSQPARAGTRLAGHGQTGDVGGLTTGDKADARRGGQTEELWSSPSVCRPRSNSIASRARPTGLPRGCRAITDSGAYVTKCGNAEWLQRSSPPRTVQHKAPLPRWGLIAGRPPVLVHSLVRRPVSPTSVIMSTVIEILRRPTRCAA
jgi:hypothetical protein